MQTSTVKKKLTPGQVFGHHTTHKAVAANQSFQLSDANADTTNPELDIILTQKASD